MSLFNIITELGQGLTSGVEGQHRYGLVALGYTFNLQQTDLDSSDMSEPIDDLESDPREVVDESLLELCQPLPQITGNEMDSDMINRICYSFHDVCSFCENYISLVNASPGEETQAKAELHYFWSTDAQDFVEETITACMEDSVADAAMVVFVVSAYVHLLLLQELAAVNSREANAEYVNACEMISLKAGQYLTHIVSIYNKCMEVRKAAVSEFEICEFETGNSADSNYWTVTWKDYHTGYRHYDVVAKDDSDSECLKERLVKSRNSYVNDLELALKASLPFDIFEVAETFNNLTKRPLGGHISEQ